MYIEKTCPECRKTFSTYVYPYKDKTYCSRECQKKACRIYKTCPVCGNEFWCLKSWPEYHCSRKCAAKSTLVKNLRNVPIGQKFCEVCKKEIVAGKGKWRGVRFCSLKCFGEHLHVEAHPKPKIRHPHISTAITKKCLQCLQGFQVKKSHAARRKFCSKACFYQWKSESGAVAGDKNFNWNNGGVKRNQYGPNWQAQRRNTRHRDNYTCQRCGITEKELGKQLDVHHINPFRSFGLARYKEANALSNLISVCRSCHRAIDPKIKAWRVKPKPLV